MFRHFLSLFCVALPPDDDFEPPVRALENNHETDVEDSTSSTVESNHLESLVSKYETSESKKYEAFYNIIEYVNSIGYFPEGHVSITKEEMLTGLKNYRKTIMEQKGVDISPFHKYFGDVPRCAKFEMIIRSGTFPEEKGTIDGIDENGQTILFHAVKLRHLQMAQCLLETGFNPNIVDKKGNTPLFYCFSKLHKDGETVKMLLKYGADIHIVNNAGQTWEERARVKRNFKNLGLVK